jgi:hypothetical protein
MVVLQYACRQGVPRHSGGKRGGIRDNIGSSSRLALDYGSGAP